MRISHLAVCSYFVSLFVLAYTFAGYGMLMAWLARLRASPLSDSAGSLVLPSVCVVLAVRNEGARIAGRLRNLLDSEYPRESLRVIVVSDGSTDDTVASAESLADHRIQVIAEPHHRGKAACVNLAISRCQAEIVVLTDARQSFATDAIRRLAIHFGDPQIGAVSGSLEIASAASATGAGVDAYWRYEKKLRAAESCFDSCIGCTGAIYAIRRELFAPIPEDTLLDDVVIPMHIALRGKRVIHEPAARAFDPQSLEPRTEERRKQRTLAGNFQMIFRYSRWLSPVHNRLWWQLLSHKFLRLLAPFFLAMAFFSNALLIRDPFFAISFASQLLFYLAAILGAAGAKSRCFSLPAAFVFLNVMTLRGLNYYLARRNRPGWE